MEYEVALAACPDYTPAACRQALVQALDPIGGLDWVRPGMRIAIKANLVSFLKPEAAATTHPQLLISLVELLCELGAEVIVGDSPGGLYNSAYVSQVYRVTGMLQVERAGAKLNRDFSQATAQYPQARGKAVSIYPLSRRCGRHHQLQQAQNPCHDGHVQQRKKYVRRHSRHLKAGVPFPLLQSRGLCPDDCGFGRVF